MAENSRQVAYEKRKKELEKRCNGCKVRTFERCDSCTTGKRLRWLQTEYSDVTGWSHNLWQNKK